MTRWLLAATAVVAMNATAARPSAKSTRRPATKARVTSGGAGGSKGQGAVTFITADAVFFDRGQVDGVTPGQKLAFTRGGKAAGTCTVTEVAEHWGRCSTSGLRVGDQLGVVRRVDAAPRPPDALPTADELMRRAERVEADVWQLRAFDRTAREAGSGLGVQAALSHTTYANVSSARGPFQQQRVDVLLSDVEIYKGLRASADVTVLNFSGRPEATRTLYTQTPVLLVHQLELGFRRADVPFSASLGRTWLRSAPGMLVLDGAQAAFRLSEGAELGAYGGLLPEAARLEIKPSQWGAGAFGRVRFSKGDGTKATLAQLSARVGYSVRDTLGARFEAGLSASLWASTTFDAHGAVELGYGMTQAPAGIDAARLDVGWRPSLQWRWFGAVRYRGLPTTGITEVGLVSPGQRAVHADLSGQYELPSGWVLGGQGGAAVDMGSTLLQGRAGPEVSPPRLWGGRIGFTLGYVEEFGWLRGRHAYLQAGLAAGTVFRFMTRTSWFQQQAVPGSFAYATNDVGSSISIEVSPWKWVRARALVMGRVPIAGTTTGVLGSVGVQISGSF